MDIIKKYNKKVNIKIGTIENNVNMKLRLLLNNSKHINDIYSDFDDDNKINLIN